MSDPEQLRTRLGLTPLSEAQLVSIAQDHIDFWTAQPEHPWAERMIHDLTILRDHLER